ncbi:MAG: diacylglycerol/lipid kinase family protein [Myxococcota bacterium]
MTRRSLVLVNPVSGGGTTGRRWPELRRALDSVLEHWDHEFTLAPGDAIRLSDQATAEGYDELVVVGGDGTLNEAVNGLMVHPAELRPSLAPVRFGTGGDFTRHLGLPTRLPDAVRHLRDGPVMRVDAGHLVYSNEEQLDSSRYFLNIASFGLSGLVDAKVNASKKRLRSASFSWAMLKSLLEYRAPEVRISVDDEEVYVGKVVTAAVANGSYFGGGMCFARGARLDDGRFQVVIQKKAGIGEFVRIRDLYSGELHRWSSVQVAVGSVVYAEPKDRTKDVLLDVDGEQLGRLPVRFQIVPGALRVRMG